MSRTASKTQTEAPSVEAEVTEEQMLPASLVREVALRAKESQGWCDEGFNEAMRDLGLPEVRQFRIPVETTTVTKRRMYVTVNSMQTEEEARNYVLANPSWTSAQLGLYDDYPRTVHTLEVSESDASRGREARVVTPCDDHSCDLCYQDVV